jgi:branched-chain amino acid transport system permease protein
MVALDGSIALLLLQDGVVSGAIYALLALSLVLVFSVTRVIFIPQGELVAFGALTLASLQAGKIPGTLHILLGASALVLVKEAARAIAGRRPRELGRALLMFGAAPAGLALLTVWAAPRALPLLPAMLLTIALLVPLGPLLYRLVYHPMAEAPVLVLLIASVALHLALAGLGLLLFGAEGVRTNAFTDRSFTVGTVTISGQSLWVVGAAAAFMLGLWLFLERSIAGKALRAAAMNRLGARLVGIRPSVAGQVSFALAALIGALSGLLVGPMTTIYYDTGFLIGLKGFVGAVFGGLHAFPAALAGALFVGLLEAFGSFWASAYKEVIVFGLLLPVLLARGLRTRHGAGDDE